jgi:hypothetical protein
MKTLILGQELKGQLLPSELARDPKVTEMRLGDINLERARRFAERLKSDKVSVYHVDAGDIDHSLINHAGFTNRVHNIYRTKGSSNCRFT